MKLKFLGLLFTSTLLAACAPHGNSDLDQTYENNDTISARAIYGADGRMDLFQVSNARMQSLAKSTVVLVRNRMISNQGSKTVITAPTYQAEKKLCSTERFKDQEAAGFCSGALVGDDLVLTAAHCITNTTDCANTSFVFGYALKQAGAQVRSVPSQNVYKCALIKKRIFEEYGTDYALIKLDRKVNDRSPLEIRRSGEVNVGDELFVIGHPAGLPTKVTVGGYVTRTSSWKYFTANTDTYGGNSGSPVFNLKTGLIEGVMVRGGEDYKANGSCNVSIKCSEMGCRGEDFTRTVPIAPYIP